MQLPYHRFHMRILTGPRLKDLALMGTGTKKENTHITSCYECCHDLFHQILRINLTFVSGEGGDGNPMGLWTQRDIEVRQALQKVCLTFGEQTTEVHH